MTQVKASQRITALNQMHKLHPQMASPSEANPPQEQSEELRKAIADAKKVRSAERAQGVDFDRNALVSALVNQFGASASDAEAAVDALGTEIEAQPSDNFGTALYVPGKVMATMRQRLIAAMTEVEAAKAVMARSSPVTKVADDGIRKIESEMRHRGYDVETKKKQALYVTEFKKGSKEFQMVGWHGTGMYNGGERTILEFYDEGKSSDKPVVSIGVLNEENVNPAKQLEVVTKIMDYVKHHG